MTRVTKPVLAEVLSKKDSRDAVVQLPGRQFPGSVIQGDSLSILCAEAREISVRIRDAGVVDEELLYLVQEHQMSLLLRLLHYQAVLRERGIELPYTNPASAGDFVILVPDE